MRICLLLATQYTNMADRQTLHDGIDRVMHSVARQKRGDMILSSHVANVDKPANVAGLADGVLDYRLL